MVEATESKQPPMAYQDDPTVREVFADTVAMLSFDGSIVRMVLGASRANPAPAGPDNRPYLTTAARLVLTPQATAALHAQLGQLLLAMEKRGMVKKAERKVAEQAKPVIDATATEAPAATAKGRSKNAEDTSAGKPNGQFRMAD